MPVTLTNTAAREIHTIIQDQDLDPAKVCLRVGVKGGGCSGFSYILDLTESKRDSDEAWEYSFTMPVKKSVLAAAGTPEAAGAADDAGDGEDATPESAFSLRVVCDPKSYLYLDGTSIDFKDEMMGRGFVFNNPRASGTCGCGSSFSA